MDLATDAGARTIDSETACHMVRGGRHPRLKYGDRTVVEADSVLVHDVAGFENAATQAGLFIEMPSCDKALLSPPRTIGVNFLQSSAPHRGVTSSLEIFRGQGRSVALFGGSIFPSNRE